MVYSVKYFPKQQKYGVILRKKKITDFQGRSRIFSQINFENDFALLDNPHLLSKVCWYDEEYNPIRFYIARYPKDNNDFVLLLTVYLNYRDELHDINDLLMTDSLDVAIGLAKDHKGKICIEARSKNGI